MALPTATKSEQIHVSKLAAQQKLTWKKKRSRVKSYIKISHQRLVTSTEILSSTRNPWKTKSPVFKICCNKKEDMCHQYNHRGGTNKVRNIIFF